MSKFIRCCLFDNWLNTLGSFLVGLILLITLFGGLLAPYPPLEFDLAHRLEPPSPVHVFGADEFGRDILSRVMVGARISLSIAVTVLSISVGVGFVVGCTAGLLGGWADEILMRITDLFLAFPALVFAVAVASALGASLESTVIAMATVSWPWYARLTRVQVRCFKNRDYVVAALSIGVDTPRLIRLYLLPNVLPTMITQVTVDVAYIILASSALSFLGLGAQPPTPEWGAMIMAARDFVYEAWWYAAFPGLALMGTCLGFNLLGDAIRDYLDPRLV